jgi:hypothetical protein
MHPPLQTQIPKNISISKFYNGIPHPYLGAECTTFIPQNAHHTTSLNCSHSLLLRISALPGGMPYKGTRPIDIVYSVTRLGDFYMFNFRDSNIRSHPSCDQFSPKSPANSHPRVPPILIHRSTNSYSKLHQFLLIVPSLLHQILSESPTISHQISLRSHSHPTSSHPRLDQFSSTAPSVRTRGSTNHRSDRIRIPPQILLITVQSIFKIGTRCTSS